MNAGDVVSVQLSHDRWATRNVLRACEALSPEQFHQKFAMGVGTLRDTAVHMIGAIQVWTDVLAQRPPRPWIDESPRRTVGELLALHDRESADLAACARLGPLDELLKRERQGVVSAYTRAVVISHVTTHGMHHRAQMLNMLRHVGIAPLPQSSVVEWSRAGCPTE